MLRYLNSPYLARSDESVYSGAANFSGRIIDLDPQSIENIEVISGLSGTLLFGPQGDNGVVLISTNGSFN